MQVACEVEKNGDVSYLSIPRKYVDDWLCLGSFRSGSKGYYIWLWEYLSAADAPSSEQCHPNAVQYFSAGLDRST